MNEGLATLNVRQLLSEDQYLIPIYQRDYSWGETEVRQLVQDIYDSFERNPNKPYYIGTLIVDKRGGHEAIYETIDGQQRLTTLQIVDAAVCRLSKGQIERNKYLPNLRFASRPKSTHTLEAMFSNLAEEPFLERNRAYNAEIVYAYKTATKALANPEIARDYCAFYKYLTEKVTILRVNVPVETDLNHYFEIMNSRGEQLEKHDIVKERLLSILKDPENKSLSHAFHLIWEACSDMSRYVQYGFSPSLRPMIFGEVNWNQFTCSTLEEVAIRINPINPSSGESALEDKKYADNLAYIATHNQPVANEKFEDTKTASRFRSVIDFPNFLLHVLRIQLASNISLDDKQLVHSFEDELEKSKAKQGGQIQFVKTFGITLLKCRWLFDNYIIKHDFSQEKERWSLLQLKWDPKNDVNYINRFGKEDGLDSLNSSNLMLLAMFHVSSPTMSYKHWLSGALNYVFHNPNTSAEAYNLYLKALAKDFLYKRYLVESPQVGFFEIAFQRETSLTSSYEVEKANWDLLNEGIAVENFVFNLMDYVLWEDPLIIDRDKFEFTSRSSVEHYYPQEPKGGARKLDSKYSNHFGNLCLISRSKNSELSNYLPDAKKQHYLTVKHDSLKQKLMMNYEEWAENEIIEHGNEMIKKLQEF